MPKTEFDYYYGVEAEQFTFVRVPKVLFADKEHFGGLSNEAKLLYGLLLERMSLSRKNNWIDKNNRVCDNIGEYLPNINHIITPFTELANKTIDSVYKFGSVIGKHLFSSIPKIIVLHIYNYKRFLV